MRIRLVAATACLLSRASALVNDWILAAHLSLVLGHRITCT